MPGAGGSCKACSASGREASPCDGRDVASGGFEEQTETVEGSVTDVDSALSSASEQLLEGKPAVIDRLNSTSEFDNVTAS